MAIRFGLSTRALLTAMRTLSRSTRYALLAAAATFLGFAASGDPTSLDSLRGALADGRNAWRTARPADYEYGYRKFCECHPDAPPETVVTVRAGKVVGVRHRPVGFDHEVQAEQRNLQFYWTVDGLFDLVDAALARGVTLRASFDAKLGFPTEVYIDYDANFIGDELDVRLTTVTALAP